MRNMIIMTYYTRNQVIRLPHKKASIAFAYLKAYNNETLINRITNDTCTYHEKPHIIKNEGQTSYKIFRLGSSGFCFILFLLISSIINHKRTNSHTI